MGAKTRPPPAHTHSPRHTQSDTQLFAALHIAVLPVLRCPIVAHAGPPGAPARTERLSQAAGSGEATALLPVAPAARELCRSDLAS